MKRRVVYPGAIPQDLDVLQPQKNVMVAFGWLIQAMLGTSTWIDGLSCVPGSGMDVNVNPGQMFQLMAVDAASFGSISADGHNIMKQGILQDAVSFNCPAPNTAGQSINYLIQARLLEMDGDSLVLPYYNANNPAVPWSGHDNDGLAQNTTRKVTLDMQVVAGAANDTGSQVTPSVSAGYTGMYIVTVANGDVVVSSGNISTYPSIPGNIAKALLSKLLTVDGLGSGLDADKFQGKSPSDFGPRFRGALVAHDVDINGYGAVNYGHSVYDTDGFWSAGSPSRLTIPTGVTFARFTAKTYFSSGYADSINLMKNGATTVGVPGMSGSIISNAASFGLTSLFFHTPWIPVTPGDYYEVNSGLSGFSDDSCWFAVEAR